MASSLTIDPLFRIQVLFENELGASTKEFVAGDLSESTFDALLSRCFAMTFPKEDKAEYNYTFKYQIEEKHESRWVNFSNTEGFGYAIQSNQDKGYVFISSFIAKKGAAIPVTPPSSVRRTGTSKTKLAKKSKSTKPKASSRGAGAGKVPVEQLILSSLKELLDVGISAPPRTQIGLFSGYKNIQSASFKNAMKKLITEGLIEYPDKETVSLTETGAAQAPSVAEPATTNEQVQERLKKMLKDKAPVIFDELKDGRSHVRSEVAALVGYRNPQSAGFKDAVKQMILLKMVEHPEGNKKLIQLTNIAFPFGRPGANGNAPVADTVTSIKSE